MTPYSYRIMRPHVCATCGSHFQSGHPNARYCTLKCQRRATILRRRGRDTTVSTFDERFHTVVHDPTIQQLDSLAKDILLDMTNNKPIKFTGIVPRWTPPKGIDLIEQQGDEFTFVMDKHTPTILELLNEKAN